ncbi:winged helix DNA-binding domain-containing protein, partial [PVC group bacterium]|nr:winged helix DNA-binding domain-containing protein [PVC group bacterium]
MSRGTRPTKISAAVARRLAIHCQGLDGRWRLPKGKESVVEVVKRLGYVQIDTIAVVQRAHHHTLWTRRPDYAPEMLHELLSRDRRVFEYWRHAAAYLPMDDYRYYVRRMRGFA